MAQSLAACSIAAPALASRFLSACMREPVDATPLWLMRQAGRYMPQYQELKRKHSFMQLVKTPELACEVTLQPIDAFDVDAAIIFADILPALEGMGLLMDFADGERLTIHNPVRSAADIDALRVLPPEETLAFTLEAIRLVRPELDRRGIPLIGFSGAPFTLASYAVEGSSDRERKHLRLRTKALMLSEPALWQRLMWKVAEVVGQYLLAQARAGAHVLQLFDSWVGVLSADDYEQFVLPYTRYAIDIARRADVPIVLYGTAPGRMLELARSTGCDVLGLDWHVPLDQAWQRLGPNVALQGNLDPAALLAPWPELRQRAKTVLDQAAGRPGHIFNLGGGIVSSPPVDNVRRLAEFVHQHSAAQLRAQKEA